MQIPIPITTCVHARFSNTYWSLKNCFPSVKIFSQIEKSCSPAPLQPLVRKRTPKLPEEGELKLNPECQTCRGHSLGVSSPFPPVHTPLRYLWETDEKDWRIRQCSHKMPSKCEWNIKVAQQRNLATQVARLCLHKHFVKAYFFWRYSHIYYALSRHHRDKVQLSSRVCEGVTETTEAEHWLVCLLLSVLQQGMNKSSFVNDITTAAHKSVQIID